MAPELCAPSPQRLEMLRAGHSSKEPILTAWSGLWSLSPVEGRHPLATRIGSICAKIFIANLKNKPVPELNFHRTDEHGPFSHTERHIPKVLSHTHVGCVHLSAVYTPSTKLQDHVQYLDVALRMLTDVCDEQRNRVMEWQWEAFLG